MMDSFKGGHPDEVPLTPEERAALDALTNLVKSWPDSLWILGRRDRLAVVRKGADGQVVEQPLRGDPGNTIVNDDYVVMRAYFDHKEVADGPLKG